MQETQVGSLMGEDPTCLGATNPVGLHYEACALEPRRDSLVAQMVKHLPTMRETQVRSLGWDDPLEEEMATHSSTLA